MGESSSGEADEVGLIAEADEREQWGSGRGSASPPRRFSGSFSTAPCVGISTYRLYFSTPRPGERGVPRADAAVCLKTLRLPEKRGRPPSVVGWRPALCYMRARPDVWARLAGGVSLVLRGYFTWLPGFTSRSTVTTLRLPSAFSAESIMPWLSMPRSLRGGRLAMKHTCLPMSCSGA